MTAKNAAFPFSRSRALVVYCLSGGHAALAAGSLQCLGFSRAGLLAGLPVTTG